MRKEYKDELNELEDRMVKAELFAKKVPMFSEQILEKKYTGEETYLKYLSYYKELRTFNGVIRGYFESGTPRYMTNNRESHKGYFWTTYINTLTEYDDHNGYGLDEIINDTPVYYYDNMNSTFYCTDEQVEGLLEALNSWIIKAKEQLKKDRVSEDIKEAEEELRQSQDKLNKLKEVL